MAKKTETAIPEIRKTRTGSVYVLANGRTIAVPPPGGKVPRKAIRKAVAKAVSSRKSLKVG